jgi:hypothetical protein
VIDRGEQQRDDQTRDRPPRIRGASFAFRRRGQGGRRAQNTPRDENTVKAVRRMIQRSIGSEQ